MERLCRELGPTARRDSEDSIGSSEAHFVAPDCPIRIKKNSNSQNRKVFARRPEVSGFWQRR
jgi:hypothetical protein